MKKVKFNITGMTCSSCSSHVEKAVNKLKGIKSVNVNLLSNNMAIEYDDNVLNNDNIIQAVKNAGYGATISNNYNKNIDNVNKIEMENEYNLNLKSMKKRVIISIIFLLPLMYLAMHNMFYEWFKIPVPNIIKNIFDGSSNAITFAFTQFLLLIPIVYVNRNYFIIGFKRLLKKSPNMDSLIAIGSGAAIVYGIFAIFMIGYGFGNGNLDIVSKYSKDIYFESAGTVLTLITFGKYLEIKSKHKTTKSVEKLINLVPNKVIVIRNEKEFEVEIKDVWVGDTLVIKPGSTIPVDGIVVEGNSIVDESSITGESIPVEKNPNDKAISGTVNKNGYLKIKALKVGEDTTISQIIKLVEEASNSKAPISKLADKVSGIFVPIVIIISILSFVFWILQGQSIEFSLNIAICVLVISCPCALGLATPVAIMVGTGIGAKNKILIKSAESLEVLSKVNTVILDKTGTITEGKPTVTDVISYNNIDILEIAGSLEKKSEHPLAQAILNKINKENIKIKDIENFTYVTGRGVKGLIDKKLYFGGNISFIKENKINISDIVTKDSKKFLNRGKTVIYFANEKEVIGIIAVADTIKESSYKLVKELKRRNINVVMVTGDNSIIANDIADKLKIKQVVSEVLPQEKEKQVELYQKNGKKVAFVGDGINDSPALARADIGIAIGSGTDIAIESADIVLVKNNLMDILTAIDLSKAVINNIKLNLFWAFFYNIIGISIASGVFYNSFNLKLSPMVGAAAMSLSSICVVTNALRLNKFKVKYKEENKMKEKSKIVFIEGMSCNHCKITVEKVLSSIEGVTNVLVSLEDKNAVINMKKDIDNNLIKTVIEDAGFEVKEIK